MGVRFTYGCLVSDNPITARRPQFPLVKMANSWVGYLATVAISLGLLMLAYGGMLVVLNRVGSLPPPAITNELCSDEKLHWLRGNLPDKPNLLVVGSSIAWRDIDSSQFVRRNPGLRPLNGGVCGAPVSETEFVANYLLGHLPSIRAVAAIVVPQDFTSCTRSQIFDPAVADAYVFGHQWFLGFYFTQFDPISLARNSFHIRSMRDAVDPFNTLEMTAYGDGPLRIGSRGLVYGPIRGYDAGCFAALRRLAASVTAEHRHFLVITGPVNPDWSALHDPTGALQSTVLDGIKAALRGIDESRLWDGAAEFAGRPSEFVDAIHINWNAAQRFSILMAEAIDKDLTAAIDRQLSRGNDGRP